jgi:hypothetical protein
MKNPTKELMAIPPEDWLEEADRRERAGDKQGAKTARQFARFLMGQKDAFENPVKSRKENYDDFDEWEIDVFRAGATQVVRLGEDLFSAIKMKDGSLVKLDEEGFIDMRSRAGQKVRKESITVGAWYGDRGEIYRQTIKNNPVTRRKGETIRDFTSRCMSEEKASFPKTKQRIAVCLSKSRKRNPLESGASISDDEDINARASNMG